ncbi:MAG TPA: tripartite tricarboxylate transporter substrate-binding protein [Beijerinckiaceae bacterium]|nr:tripartite tricarboxylate transporter substrate-binding protein [Beijerinckiaceae bacterium]
MTKLRGFALSLILACGISSAGAADYYTGKTIALITGYGAGGGYSAYSQLVAKYLGRHIPGHPAVIAQNMPGGGSIVAVNYVYNAAKPDGLTIASVNMFNMYSDYMLKKSDVRYELPRMPFVGNLRTGNAVFLMRADRYPTLDSLKQATQPIHLGSATKGDGHYLFGLAMGKGLGIDFQYVIGYSDGGGEIDLALDRGELDGRFANLNSYLLSKPDWIKNGFVKILAQGGIEKGGSLARDPRIADVPTMDELFPGNQMVQQLTDFGSLGDLLSGVYIAPPKTPPDLLALLRKGFIETLDDPDFRADAAKFNLEITPMGPEEVENIVDRALKVSPDVLKMVGDLTQ